MFVWKRSRKGELIQTDEKVLFGKYRIIKIIGKGAVGTVYLAEHITLREPRAVKKIPASDLSSDCQGVLNGEAEILKSLKHNGIPVIYDIETDDRYIYLIEEFIEGDSLKALVEDKGNLSLAEIIRYGCELCRIIAFLHSNKPDPIYYLDLQPNNVLICRGTLKLVDFDKALFKSRSDIGRRYGTEGFASPELYGRASIDERADIFAIGALLYYMETGKPPGLMPDYRHVKSARLASVIKKCLAIQKDERFKSCYELEKALISLKSKENDTAWPLLKIAVCGSRPGVGVTHTAFEISDFLEDMGLSAYVHEKNQSGAVMKAVARQGLIPDICGVYHLEQGRARPEFGPGVNLENPALEVEICDFGNDLKSVTMDDFHLILLLCGSAPWEMDDSENSILYLACRGNLQVIFGRTPPDQRIVFQKDIKGISCFRYPEGMKKSSLEIKGFYRSVFENTEAGDILFGKGPYGNKSANRKNSSEGRSSVWDYFRKKGKVKN